MIRLILILIAAAVALHMAPGSPASAAAATETAVVFASDATANDDFGSDVALDGTTLVVGAPFADIAGQDAQGAVYVFELVGGLWTEVQKLTASDGAAYDQLGFSVAVSGDRIVAGAEEAAIGTNSSQGAAYVFERSGGVWTEVHKLAEPTTILNFAEYGHDVDVDGDWIVVGGPKAGSAQHGRAYVYHRDEGGPGAWGLVAELQDDVYDTNAGFGTRVDLDGDLLAVGAELLDLTPGTYDNEGGAYVFLRGAGNVWTQIGKLFGSTATDNDRAGRAVAVDGTTVVVGAHNYESGGYSRGVAYVFENPTLTPGAWLETAILLPSDPQDFSRFGQSVGILGTDVWVGAVGFDTDAGKVYRFGADQGGAGAWGEAEQYAHGAAAANELAGYRIAATVDHVAVGALTLGGTGAVLIFAGPGGGASAVADDAVPGAPLGDLAAYPNPFNPETTLRFTVDRRGEVEILVHDLRGALVARVFRGELEAGPQQVNWRAEGLSSGVYLATVRADKVLRTTRVALVK